MTIDQKKKMLTLDHKLDPAEDFYVAPPDEFGSKIIIRRSGIDKLEHEAKMNFTIESMQVVPYGDKVSVTILGRGVIDNVVARTVAMANPDNCAYPHYAEVAENRCRHRLLLKLLRLYEHHIFSQIEDSKWIETRNLYIGAVEEVQKMLAIGNATTNKKEPRLGPTGVRAGSAAVQGTRP